MKPELKEKHLKEVKKLEQEYLRNINTISETQEKQCDITSRIQIIYSKL